MSPLLFCCVGNTFQSPLLAALYNAEAEALGNPSRAISAGLSNRTVMPPTAVYLFESVARALPDRPEILAALRAHQPTPLRSLPFRSIAGACLVHEPARKPKDLADDEKAMRAWLATEAATPLMKLAVDDPGYREWKARGEPALGSPDGEAVLAVYAQQVAVVRVMATALAAATAAHPDQPPLPVVQPPPPPSVSHGPPEAEVFVMRVRHKTGEIPLPTPPPELRRPEPPPAPVPEPITPTPRATVRKIVGVQRPPTPAAGITRKPEYAAGAKPTSSSGAVASPALATSSKAASVAAPADVPRPAPAPTKVSSPEPETEPEVAPRKSADAPKKRAAAKAPKASAPAEASSDTERAEALEDVRSWLRAALPVSRAALSRHGLVQRAEKHFTSWDEAVRAAGIEPAEPLWQLPRDPDLSLDILIEALPDDVVARITAMDVKKVRARRKANDAPDPANQLRRRLVATEKLGKVPDADLAAQLLIPVEVVVAVREVEGLAPCATKMPAPRK